MATLTTALTSAHTIWLHKVFRAEKGLEEIKIIYFHSFYNDFHTESAEGVLNEILFKYYHYCDISSI